MVTEHGGRGRVLGTVEKEWSVQEGLHYRLVFFILILIFFYFRESTNRGGTERERERDRGSEAGSVLTVDSLMWGSNSGTTRS